MSMQMILIMLATAVTYFMSIILLKSYFETSYMDRVFFLKVGLIALITWTPVQLIYLIVSWMVYREILRPFLFLWVIMTGGILKKCGYVQLQCLPFLLMLHLLHQHAH